MRRFEYLYRILEPFLPALNFLVRQQIDRILSPVELDRSLMQVLDVGGRKSHYSIGVQANICITELPRSTELQDTLNLGMSQNMLAQLLSRRSNIFGVILDDMTHTSLACKSFDCVMAIEVLEHVEEDDLFVSQVSRVLRPYGVFLMTTPNGDHIPNTNPDHKRHYSRLDLFQLLCNYFEEVNVIYVIHDGPYHDLGTKSWSMRDPIQTGTSMFGNLINRIQSPIDKLSDKSMKTCHLMAIAKKPRVRL